MNELATKLDDLLAQVRDTLLDWNRNALQAEDNKRDQADIVYELAKQAEDIRRMIKEVSEGRHIAHQRNDRKSLTGKTEERKQQVAIDIQKSKREYPKYFRRGDDTLVKVGLRRNKKSVYKQIIPSLIYQQFGEIATKVGKDGKTFTSEVLLREFETYGSSPSYHMYSVLSLLVQKKQILEVRRGVYKLGNESVQEAMESIWKLLPEESYE